MTPPPIIAHVHLPRCAGTAVWEALWVHFAGKVLRIQGFDYGLQDIITAFEADPTLMAVSSHQLRYEFPARIAGRDVRYVTFLRDPAEQVCSWIRYVRANYRNIPESTRNLMELPDDLDRLPLDEAVEQLLRGLQWPSVNNLGGWFLPCGFFWNHVAPLATIDTLSSFAVVGIVDNLDAGVAAIGKLIGASLMKPRQINESKPWLDWQTSPRLQAFLDDALSADRKVYRWASGLGFCVPGR